MSCLRRILIALFSIAVISVIITLIVLRAIVPEPLPADQFGTGADGLPNAVEFVSPNYGPEGVEWNPAREQFLVGSLTFGTVSLIADDGTMTPFVEDARFLSTAGLQVDVERNRLLVTNSQGWTFLNPTLTGQAGLGIYDLTTGEPIAYADFTPIAPQGTRFFANDVTMDTDGNAYVTNSFGGQIFRVNPAGEAMVFVSDERLTGGFIGLNGIEAHPDGYLIVSMAGASQLWKVPLDDPKALALVTLDQPVRGDGLALLPDGDLLVVAGREGVHRLRSDDDWQSAITVRVIETERAGTTIALREGVPYLLYAYLTNPSAQRYQIVRLAVE